MTIVLVILGAIVLLLLTLLFLPLTIDFKYYDKVKVSVKYLGIKIFDSDKKDKVKKRKNSKQNKNQNTIPEPKRENFIKKIYKQKGLNGTISYFSDILILLLKRLCWIVKRFRFRRFVFDLVVASGDAAKTAIQYGKICTVLYPVFSLLQSTVDIKTNEINVNADFEKSKWEFKSSILVKTKALYWLITAVYLLIQISKLQHKECEKT